MVKFLTPMALLATTLTTTFAAPAGGVKAAVVQPDPTKVYINGITYGGTGCPQGSVGSFISDDRQTFTLIFDSYIASIGPGVAVTENRKNCQLNVDLQYPSGFQYSIFQATYRGYVGLDANVSALQKSTYYFSGQTAQASASTPFTGPISKDYELTDAIPFASTVFSPCGASLPMNINSQVRLTSTNAQATGQITDDSVDGKVTFIIGLQWQKCSPSTKTTKVKGA